jgi:hypothetical protein
MDNMRKNCFILLCTSMMFMIDSCTINPEKENLPNYNLEGVWARSARAPIDPKVEDDIEIIISNGVGKFHKIYSGNWKTAQEQGLIKLGDVKITNIKKISTFRWRCDDLYADYDRETGVVSQVDWEKNVFIEMNPDGKTFSITYTDDAVLSYVFRRK